MIEEVQTFIAALGFPIAVVCYLLWERHTMIAKFTKAINDLRLEIVKLNERCDGKGKG